MKLKRVRGMCVRLLRLASLLGAHCWQRLANTELGQVLAQANTCSEQVLAQANTCSEQVLACLLYTSPSPRDATLSRMPSSA